MPMKEAAKHLIDELPDDATMDDIIHALYIRAKFERGEKQVRDGKGISHRVARQRIMKWAR